MCSQTVRSSNARNVELQYSALHYLYCCRYSVPGVQGININAGGLYSVVTGIGMLQAQLQRWCNRSHGEVKKLKQLLHGG